MKTTKILSIALTTIMALTAWNCGTKKEETQQEAAATEVAQEEKTPAPSAPLYEVDGAFQTQIASVFASYVLMKEAFVATDAAKTKEEAAKLAAALQKVDMNLLTGAAHTDWMAYVRGMENAIKEIQATDDIEAQRKSFSNLSDNLYKSIKAYGLGGVSAYYEYCPMAFDNTGAYWLSDNSTVRNPYFGDKMLSCGKVAETLN